MTSYVLQLLAWLAGWWVWGRPRSLGTASTAPRRGVAHRRVVVVVPVRNEAAVIAGLLEDLLEQTIAVEVIVVDDDSTDGTAQVAGGFADGAPDRIRVERTPPLPEGWVGKNWACHYGAEAAFASGLGDADVLVFLDADVRLEPTALARVVDGVRPGHVVSVQPFHETQRAYEQLSVLPGVVALAAIGAGRRSRDPHGLCGPLVAMSVADHRRLGGHRAVRGELVEDLALGRRFAEIGVRTTVLLGGRSVRYRMYPAGLAQLVEGWTKNLATGAGAVPWWSTALTALWITGLGSAALDLARVPFASSTGAVMVAIGSYAAFALQIGVLGRRAGSFGVATAVAYPVPLVAFVALFFRSAWHSKVRRRVGWRGRQVALGKAAGSP